MQNRNISFFINSLSSGGAEHQLVILANLLFEEGYNVSIATYGDVSDHYDVHSDIKRIHIAPNKSKIHKILAIWKFAFSVKSDCIIIFCQRNSFFLLPPLFLRMRRKLKVICGERNLSMDSDKIEYLLFKYLYKRADHVVSNSYSQKRYIIHKCPKLAQKVTVITNYTDKDQYTYNPPPNNKHRRIGIFCRYEKQKNCLRFVEATRRVMDAIGDTFIVEWYGRRDLGNETLQDYYHQLSNKIKELGLSQIIHLNDSVKNVSSLISQFDIICLPSLFEGFSNSIAEAICCGKPMVVSDVSDNSLMVHDGENGYLFNPLEENDIANAIVKILKKPNDELNEMGEKSRLIAESLFDKKKFVESYKKLIET